jgi:hypothetical protein
MPLCNCTDLDLNHVNFRPRDDLPLERMVNCPHPFLRTGKIDMKETTKNASCWVFALSGCTATLNRNPMLADSI